MDSVNPHLTEQPINFKPSEMLYPLDSKFMVCGPSGSGKV